MTFNNKQYTTTIKCPHCDEEFTISQRLSGEITGFAKLVEVITDKHIETIKTACPFCDLSIEIKIG